MDDIKEKFDRISLAFKMDDLISGTTGRVWYNGNEKIAMVSPINGNFVAHAASLSSKSYEEIKLCQNEALKFWMKLPAPKRGEIVRQIGENFRKHKNVLAEMITIECGKSIVEARGEVQEIIDICDFAVGLSRQLYGFTMHSERIHHRLYEQYHPLGRVGIITAFNFPAAVWAWNAMIALVCGNVCFWKPSEKTLFTAILCHKIIEPVLENNHLPEGILAMGCGGKDLGEKIVQDRSFPLISATGSVEMGRSVAQKVSERLGKILLELGGNNAIVVTPHANLDLAARAIVFSAVGTAGQRCTTCRRLIIHEKIYSELVYKLHNLYKSIKVGNPFDEANHMGPLIDNKAVENYFFAIDRAISEGGKVIYGYHKIPTKGNYVLPTLIEMPYQSPIVHTETFAPILYLIKYDKDIYEAIHLNNEVSQGLSSAIFSDSLQEVEIFLSQFGSDCGIANVNIGTSGAEIGGAFGGEKETGGGRESGSDSWKAYMRRQTVTINFGNTLPLSQGIEFNV
jgi:aldehyde dehydrogenase (NAD+)